MRKNSGGVLGELLRRRNVLLAESHERQVAALALAGCACGWVSVC